MRWPFTYGLFLAMVVTVNAQVIKFQSVGFAGTTTNPAGTTTKHSMAIGTIASQGAGQSNQSGFYWGDLDYRPAQQASGIAFSSLTPNQLTLSWTNGNGTRRLVVGHATTAVTATLSAATAYAANTVFGSGAEIGASSGNFAVYDGTSNTVTITNLSPSTVYHFKVFEYNGKYGANNANIEYQPGTFTGNPANRTTLALPPTTAATGLTFSNVTKNQSTVSWTNGNGTNRIVIVKQGSAVNAPPVNGQGYSFNTIFGSGDDLGSANYVSYIGSSPTTITNLLPNTVYHYKVVEYTGSGANDNFLLTSAPVSSQLTLTTEPIATTATAMQQTSFAANWQTVTGASNYYIDVSDDPNFGTFVPTYQNKSIGNLLTWVIDGVGINAGTTYYYRVRAENAAGSSANSNAITVLTVPATPTVQSASPISTTGFTTHWSASATATGYIVDIATNPTFTQLVNPFADTTVTGSTQLVVNDLTAGTGYYIRVRAQNTSGTSPSSTGYNQFTLPEAPVAEIATNTTSTSFVAHWKTVAGAVSYELNVVVDSTGIAVTGYPGLPFNHPQDNKGVQNLSHSTEYKYFVRAKNDGGFSAKSNEMRVITLDSTEKPFHPPSISISPSSTSSQAVAVAGGVEVPLQIFFKHRRITDTQFIVEPPVSLTAAGNHPKDIITSWLDELGVEYYFVLKDAGNRYDSTNAAVHLSKNEYAYQSFSSQGIVGFEAGFNGTPASYKMFSIPADLGSNKAIDILFQPVLSQFGKDKSKWRMFHYPGGGTDKAYQEFDTDLSIIEPGRGYWFIAREVPAPLKITAGVIQANQSKDFELNIETGWNQIGNPFPFSIFWPDVKAANTAAELKSIWVFDKSTSNYKKTDVLPPWQGAFVFSGQGGKIKFPVLAKTSKTGRKMDLDYPNLPDEGMWHLSLALEHGGLSAAGVVGMHPEASNSMDRFDELTPPRFITYLEMKTRHEEYFAHQFSEDVVTTGHQYTWKFTVASNAPDGKAALNWDPAAWSSTSAALLLLDISNQILVDMKTTDRYEFVFASGKQFKIIYNREAPSWPGTTLLGQAYPNPFINHVEIPVLIEKEKTRVKLEVYDLLGKRIKVIETEYPSPGLYQVEWDGIAGNGEETVPGMLLYRLTQSTDNNPVVRRMIKSK